MSNSLKVAVIGSGNIARHAHVPAWLNNPNTEIVAICDPNKTAMKQIVDRYHLTCACYSSYDDLLRSVPPDIVDICTPAFLHVEQATQALKAGCHVLVEKPPASSSEAAKRLIELANERQRKIGAILNYRYRDLVLQLKQTIADGKVGKVVKVNIIHHGPFVYTETPWLWDEKQSKYLLWEFGIHFIDILVHLLGTPKRIVSVLPFEKSSIGQTTDLEITVEFEDGALGRLEIISDTTRHSSFFTHINVYGTAMDCFVRWFPPSLRLVAGQVNPIGLILDEVKSTWSVTSKILRGQFIKHRNISHYRVIDNYVEYVAGRADYPLTFARILPTLQLLEEIERHIPSYQTLAGHLTKLDL